MCRVCEREYFGALIFVMCVSTERHRRLDKRDERSVRGACEESAPDQFVVFAERKAAQRIQGERAPRARRAWHDVACRCAKKVRATRLMTILFFISESSIIPDPRTHTMSARGGAPSNNE